MKNTWLAAVLAASLQIAAPALSLEPSVAERVAVPRLDGSPRAIVPGVYSLGELAPMQAYLIESDDGLVLVDTGYAGQLDRLAQAIDGLGFDPRDIRHIVVTHLHLDHWMNMDYIRSMTGARTYMGAADARVVEKGAPVEVVIPARIAPPGLAVPPTRVDVKLEGDQELGIAGLALRAIDCAGHTPGSVCYLLETGPWKILFGGDTMMSVRSGLGTYMTRLHPELGGDVEAYRRTLTRLAKLPVNMILPGHPYFDRRRGGLSPHPVVSVEGWRAILRAGLDELDLIEARFERDGRDFLDGRPSRVEENLIYLGGSAGQAAYAVESENGVCLIDPFRLASEDLRARLLEVGVRRERVTDVLVTRPSPRLERTLEALGAGSQFRLWGPSPALRTVRGTGVRRREVRPGDSVEACEHRFEVVSTSAWQVDSLGYLARVGRGLAAFTGDGLSPLTADEIVAYRDSGPAPGASFESLVELEDLDVRLWLPGRPFAAQNANLYDDQWRRTVRINRLALASERLTR